jgi:hypothetical protein
MHKISISFNSAEHRQIVVLARNHQGNLSATVRSLLHSQSVAVALTEAIEERFKTALEPLVEADDLTQRHITHLLETETKNAENLTAIREGLKRVVEFITTKK